MIKKKFLLFVILLLIILVFLFVSKMVPDSSQENKVCFKNHCFYVELAKTRAEKARGLMFRENLDLDKGMLFIFEEEGKYPFWMKNTLLPLDIIWLNKEKEVVFLRKNVLPCSEEDCQTIRPDKKAKYVLEVNGGLADKIGLRVGDKLTFYLLSINEL